MIGAFIQVNAESSRGKTDPVGYVIQEDGCWTWVGSMGSWGYGQWTNHGDGSSRAHRRLYEMSVGAVAPGMVLDHLCRNPACVRPDHLEPVTVRENLLRGVGVGAKNIVKTHCPHGHPYTPENTLRRKKGHRTCRTCNCARLREYKRRKKGAA